MIVEIAPAKVNLYLHVGGLRSDGLHDLASLFCFVDAGDIIRVEPAQELSLSIEGPFAEALAPFPIDENLVMCAGERLRDLSGLDVGAKMTLTKNLPVAAGIGGGSADAAAALRALVALWNIDIDKLALAALAFQLGADVPACLEAEPIFVSGAGEQITPGPILPPTHICLVNPGVATPTGPIFNAFDAAYPAPATPIHMEVSTPLTAQQLASALMSMKNDLQQPAIDLVPEIDEVLNFIDQQKDCLLSRMSGSGATCFGLFADASQAAKAASAARAQGWWAQSGKIL